MAKRNHKMALLRNEQGQISIFFSASLIVMITIVAFVINIGLFVKAKINLQNATDAAAYAGAAVQSRQLTRIAYLNWEMRNIFKEWMYKYYVVGNLNLPDVENNKSSGVMNFRLKNSVDVLATDPALRNTYDAFNIPAVCIHIANAKTNICKRYAVPGLPEFGSSNLPGAEQASRAFMNVLISSKVDDCVSRTAMNMNTALTWAYNIRSQNSDAPLAGKSPAILADRQGAWPRAVELAIRIRNLEKLMNTPPIQGGVCGSGDGPDCVQAINGLEGKIGNERIVKAFYSGYRNLGGATTDSDSNEMQASFTLTEIPPTPVSFDKETDASNFLVPNSSLPNEKYWVDLKLMMVNYATFYAAMIPSAAQGGAGNLGQSGKCDVSKIAVPVPGYPLGFYKNPELVTYYAVRGEANFIGLFNPFDADSIKMTAYSAAKPFGGRIGPALFVQGAGQDFVRGRKDRNLRSIPYLTSYDFKGTKVGTKIYDGVDFFPGVPLPTNSDVAPGAFWMVNSDDPVGGKIANANDIKFGVPNLVYDYEGGDFTASKYSLASEPVYIIKSAGFVPPTGGGGADQGSNPSEQKVGLFNAYQFSRFMGGSVPAQIGPQELDQRIAIAKAPTRYEAANYLIPTPDDFNQANGLDSFGFINTPSEDLPNDYKRYRASVYAPLFGADLLYTNSDQVKTAILDFMKFQEPSMKKYMMALNRAAISVYKQQYTLEAGAIGAAQGFKDAAKRISDIDFSSVTSATAGGNVDDAPDSCNSIAGQFLYYYYGESGNGGALIPSTVTPSCPVPLKRLIEEYFAGTAALDNFSSSYYAFDLTFKSGSADSLQLLSAYMPGPYTGVGQDGNYESPLTSEIRETMRRNSYSTKFITLSSLFSDGDGYGNKGIQVHAEGIPNERVDDIYQTNFKNILDYNKVNPDINSIKY